jgi:hypothetical protein
MPSHLHLDVESTAAWPASQSPKMIILLDALPNTAYLNENLDESNNCDGAVTVPCGATSLRDKYLSLIGFISEEVKMPYRK